MSFNFCWILEITQICTNLNQIIKMDELSYEGQAYIKQIKRLACQPSQSSASNYESKGLTQRESDQAILQFRRQIQERFKISVANKLYTFPRKYLSISDFVSSDEEENEQMPEIPVKVDSSESFTKFKKKTNNYEENPKKKKHNETSHRHNHTNSSRIQGKSKSKKKMQKQPHHNKRLQTEPNSMNYMQTIRSKMKKI